MKSIMVVLLLLCVARCAASQDKYPTPQEIQQDIYKRQHESECRKIQADIWNRQGRDMLAKKPLATVNSLTPDETPLASKCGSTLVHLQHVEVQRAVGCYQWGGWRSSGDVGGIMLAGPHDKYYELVTQQHTQNYGNPHPEDETDFGLTLGRYYEVTYWRWIGGWEAVPDHLDHPLDKKDLGKCAEL